MHHQETHSAFRAGVTSGILELRPSTLKQLPNPSCTAADHGARTIASEFLVMHLMISLNLNSRLESSTYINSLKPHGSIRAG